MVRELPKDFYKAKPKNYGNGARLKAFKKHIGKEMIIMTKDKYKEFMDETKKMKKISDTEADRDNEDIVEKWSDAE